MSELKFNDITDSLADGFDPVLREELFSRLEVLDTEDDALKGVQLFVQKHGRDYELMRNTFKSFSDLLDTKEKKKMNLNWIKYAAALILIPSIFYFLYWNKNNLDLISYEYHDKGLPVLMGDTNNVMFSNAMSSYKMQDFSKALQEMSKCSETDTVLFYKGVCNYELGEYKNAIPLFKKIKTPSVYTDKSIYLMALAYLHEDKKSEAIGILIAITLTNSEFKKQASTLLEELRYYFP